MLNIKITSNANMKLNHCLQKINLMWQQSTPSFVQLDNLFQVKERTPWCQHVRWYVQCDQLQRVPIGTGRMLTCFNCEESVGFWDLLFRAEIPEAKLWEVFKICSEGLCVCRGLSVQCCNGKFTKCFKINHNWWSMKFYFSV